MAALVPGDDAPPGIGEQRRYQVERRREVHAAVAEQHGRCVEVSPLVGRDLDAVGIDPPTPIGTPRAGIGEGVLGCGSHTPRLTVLGRGLIGLVG